MAGVPTVVSLPASVGCQQCHRLWDEVCSLSRNLADREALIRDLAEALHREMERHQATILRLELVLRNMREAQE